MRRKPITVVSVNTGLPRTVAWNGGTVTTSIWKTPVAGRVDVGRLNLDGDRQSDLTKHGGDDKAVYAYPAEHYSYWRRELPGADLTFGAFGENLTVEGLSEKTLRIGDRLVVGSAELVVRQPRMPCFKLGLRFASSDLPRRFLRSGRTGCYLAVTKTGSLAAGDAVTLMRTASKPSVTVAQFVALYAGGDVDRDLLRAAAESPDVPKLWRDYFRARLASEEGELSAVWREYFLAKPWQAEGRME